MAEKYDGNFRYLRSLVHVRPNKKVSISGTFEKIVTGDNTTVGVCFPQEVTDNEGVEEVVGTVAEAVIKDLKYYGYLEIDFVVDRSHVMLSGVHWGISSIGSSIFYF